MKVKKYIWYLGIQSLLLLLIIILFVFLSKNDVWNAEQLDISYQSHRIPIQVKNRVPMMTVEGENELAFASGYIQAFYRSVQLKYLLSMVDNELAYQLKDSTLIPLDVFISTLDLDSLAHTIVLKLPEKTRAYIEAYISGLNEGFTIRKKHKKLPFLIYKFRDLHFDWTVEKIIKVMILERMLIMPQWRLLLDEIYNARSLPAHKEIKKYVKKTIKLIQDGIDSRAFYYTFKTKNHFELLLFEQNEIPSFFIPYIVTLNNKKLTLVNVIGNPFPISINSISVQALDDYSLVPGIKIYSNRKNRKTVPFRNFVQTPNGRPYYFQIKKYNRMTVLAENNDFIVTCYFPDADQLAARISQMFLAYYNLPLDEINKQEYNLVWLNDKNVPIIGHYHQLFTQFNSYLQKQKVSLKDFQDSLLNFIRGTLPEKSENDTLQAMINMIKYEKNIDQNFSILPAIWFQLFKKCSSKTDHISSLSPFLDMIQCFTRDYSNIKLDEQNLKEILTTMQKMYGNDFIQWQWEKLFSKSFRYYLKNINLETYFKSQKIKWNLHFGFKPGGIIFTPQKERYWFNSLYIINDEIYYNSPLNDQVNDPQFWNFNQEDNIP